MNLDQLELFIDVVRAGGFAAVAKERNVAPSSVSRAIAALETSLQARLFHRTTRTLSLTDAGERFHRRVVPLVEELDAARASLAEEASSEARGRLRVTASVSFGQIVLAGLLGTFRRACPHVEIDLILSDARLDLVAERIDVALRHGGLPSDGGLDLIARKLCDVRYRLIASPAYLAAAQAIAEPEDIAAHAVMTFPYQPFAAAWWFRLGERVVKVPIRPAVTATNAAALAAYARAGLGLALLADWTVAQDLASGQLVEVLPGWSAGAGDDDTSASAVWVVLPSRSFVPAKTRGFVDHLISGMRRGR